MISAVLKLTLDPTEVEGQAPSELAADADENRWKERLERITTKDAREPPRNPIVRKKPRRSEAQARPLCGRAPTLRI
jgi:hypothetical protein